MILVCNAPGHLDAVLDAVGDWNAPDSSNRLSAMRGRVRVDRDELFSSATWQQARAAIELLNDSPSP